MPLWHFKSGDERNWTLTRFGETICVGDPLLETLGVAFPSCPLPRLRELRHVLHDGECWNSRQPTDGCGRE